MKHGEEYFTIRGNSYTPVSLYDKRGKFHGHAIYQKLNNVENEKPEFVFYLSGSIDKKKRFV